MLRAHQQVVCLRAPFADRALALVSGRGDARKSYTECSDELVNQKPVDARLLDNPSVHGRH